MSFLLPAQYTSAAEAPQPTDERVTLVDVPAKTIAVSRFSGWANEESVKGQLNTLVDSCVEDGLVAANAELQWNLAQYNPPWTVPWCRRNEIWLTLEKNEAEITDSAASASTVG